MKALVGNEIPIGSEMGKVFNVYPAAGVCA